MWNAIVADRYGNARSKWCRTLALAYATARILEKLIAHSLFGAGKNSNYFTIRHPFAQPPWFQQFQKL